MKTAVRIVRGFAIGLVVATAALNPVTASAAPADFLACAAEKDDARRLACFDAAVIQEKGQPTSSLQASVAAAPPPPPPLSMEEKFGLRGDLKQEKAKQAPELAELQELHAKVTNVATKPYGELVVTLDNGQVWYEIQTNSGIRVKAGDPVVIKAGALNSFILVAPNRRSSKVTRAR